MNSKEIKFRLKILAFKTHTHSQTKNNKFLKKKDKNKQKFLFKISHQQDRRYSSHQLSQTQIFFSNEKINIDTDFLFFKKTFFLINLI